MPATDDPLSQNSQQSGSGDPDPRRSKPPLGGIASSIPLGQTLSADQDVMCRMGLPLHGSQGLNRRSNCLVLAKGSEARLSLRVMTSVTAARKVEASPSSGVSVLVRLYGLSRDETGWASENVGA